MYKVHQDATLLPVTIKSNDYIVNNEKLPAVSVSASKDKNGIIHISLVNIDMHNNQNIEIDFDNIKLNSLTGRILVSPKIQDCNTFDNPEKINPAVFNGANIKGKMIAVKLPPASVVVLEVK
jgi:alpha-L-arabinofuranosidase